MGQGVEEGTTVTNSRNPGLDCEWQRGGVEVRKLFSCRLWCLHPCTLILCVFYGGLSSEKQLGSDADVVVAGPLMVNQPPLMVAGIDSSAGVPQPHFVV